MVILSYTTKYKEKIKMVLAVDKWLHLWEKVLLPCENCGTTTVHALNKSGTHYVCGCGDQIEIEYKENE